MTTRSDEWHIKVDLETRRRLKAYAAMKGLTLGQALKLLLDTAADGVQMEQSGPKMTDEDIKKALESHHLAG